MPRRAAALVLLLGCTALAAACASATGARPKPFPTAGRAVARLPSATVAPSATPFAAALLQTALALAGTPYRHGGSDPGGFDCSGFVWYVFAQQGVGVPRTVAELFGAGARVGRGQTTAGDLLFFGTGRRGPTHVAIALGDGRFVHAPSSRGVVRVESLDSSYWGSRVAGVRRIGPDAAAGPTPPDGGPYR